MKMNPSQHDALLLESTGTAIGLPKGFRPLDEVLAQGQKATRELRHGRQRERCACVSRTDLVAVVKRADVGPPSHVREAKESGLVKRPEIGSASFLGIPVEQLAPQVFRLSLAFAVKQFGERDRLTVNKLSDVLGPVDAHVLRERTIHDASHGDESSVRRDFVVPILGQHLKHCIEHLLRRALRSGLYLFHHDLLHAIYKLGFFVDVAHPQDKTINLPVFRADYASHFSKPCTAILLKEIEVSLCIVGKIRLHGFHCGPVGRPSCSLHYWVVFRQFFTHAWPSFAFWVWAVSTSGGNSEQRQQLRLVRQAWILGRRCISMESYHQGDTRADRRARRTAALPRTHLACTAP